MDRRVPGRQSLVVEWVCPQCGRKAMSDVPPGTCPEHPFTLMTIMTHFSDDDPLAARRAAIVAARADVTASGVVDEDEPGT